MRPFGVAALIGLAFAACEVNAPAKLAFDLETDRVTLVAGESRSVQLTVVGARRTPVTIQGRRLPAFVLIEGTELRIAPPLTTMPSQQIVELIASTGPTTWTSADFTIVVTRPNTPPRVDRPSQWAEGFYFKREVNLSELHRFDAVDLHFDSDPLAHLVHQ